MKKTMEIIDILLGAAISGLFAVLGTYVGFRFMLNKVKKGLVTDVFYDLLADITEDKELQAGITNILNLLMGTVMSQAGITRTKRSGGLIGQLYELYQMYKGIQAKPSEEQAKSPF